MTKSRGRVHYCLAKGAQDVYAEIKAALEAGVDFVRLTPEHITDNFSEKIKAANVDRSKLILVNDPVLALSLGLENIFLEHSELDIFTVKSTYPNLNFGGLAHSLADSKNLELAKADYIEMTAPNNGRHAQPLGSELFQDVIPKEETYGWVVVSLNTPVVASGLKSLNEVEKLVGSADIKGVIISGQFEPRLELKTTVSELKKILG